MFRVKICGLRSLADAELVNSAGADAVGFNFFRKSRRFVEVDVAQEIIRSLLPGVMRVGVFVDSSIQEILEIANCLRLDWIQLHGLETPEFVARLGRPVIKAFRFNGGAAPIRHYVNTVQEMGGTLASVMIDSASGGEFGGTGQVADWESLSKWEDKNRPRPLILAGGLNPRNVAQAIRLTRPYGVDVASGVELSPGVKSPELVLQFVQNARAALGV